MPGPKKANIRYVNQNDTETVTVTTTVDTSLLAVYYLLLHPDGSYTQIGTVANGDSASTPFTIDLDYDIDDLGADEFYRVVVKASDGGTIEVTLWPDSTAGRDAEEYVFVRNIPGYS